MVSNLAPRTSQADVATFLDASCPRGSYDMIYIPCDFATKKNFGYAFINFTSPHLSQSFRDEFDGRPCERIGNDTRPLIMRRAHIQGLEANALLAKEAKSVVKNATFRRMLVRA